MVTQKVFQPMNSSSKRAHVSILQVDDLKSVTVLFLEYIFVAAVKCLILVWATMVVIIIIFVFVNIIHIIIIILLQSHLLLCCFCSSW